MNSEDLHSERPFSGSKYVGQWRQGFNHGSGKRVYANGIEYDGQWKENLYDGEGVATYPVGQWKGRYVGQWKGGKRNGKGKQKYADGNEYNGQWKDNACDGEGVAVYARGESYTGQWKNSVYDGEGEYTFPDGSKFKGYWKKDAACLHPVPVEGGMHGDGVWTGVAGDWYKGQWKDFRFDGKGVFRGRNRLAYPGIRQSVSSQYVRPVSRPMSYVTYVIRRGSCRIICGRVQMSYVSCQTCTVSQSALRSP